MRHIPLFLFGFVLFGLGQTDLAGGEKKAEPPLQPLWKGPAPGAKDGDKDVPGIHIHLPKTEKSDTPAVVICPGGGYGGLAISYEGHDVARWLNTLGIAGIVLKYRHAPKYQHPIPLEDAQRALRYVRAHAKEWRIDPGRVGILGFSAGGHLASTAGTHFDYGVKGDPITEESCRPDFMVLVYPVITMTDPYTHKGSRRNLLGETPSAQLIDELSNEKQVSKETPPTFLAHTSEDAAVPPQNSVLFYQALVANKVPAELHIYEKGQHGLGMDRRPDLPFSSWTKRCAAWMDGRGITGKTR